MARKPQTRSPKINPATTPHGEAKREPHFAQASADWDPANQLKWRKTENPLPHGTLGDIGLATEVVSAKAFPQSILVIPFEAKQLVGIDAATVRMFRWDAKAKT